MLLAAVPAAAQTDEVVRAALYLTGADSPEELDDRLVDELESFRNRPLPLNRASRARLLDSGLLTPYQVAALAEYRSLSGDVLSFAELERVDGFGKEAVAALRPFLSLESARHPGEAVRDTLKFRHSALVRATLKDLGAKYRLMGLERPGRDILRPLPAPEREDSRRRLQCPLRAGTGLLERLPAGGALHPGSLLQARERHRARLVLQRSGDIPRPGVGLYGPARPMGAVRRAGRHRRRACRLAGPAGAGRTHGHPGAGLPGWEVRLPRGGFLR